VLRLFLCLLSRIPGSFEIIALVGVGLLEAVLKFQPIDTVVIAL
jgi:hypothetical protein